MKPVNLKPVNPKPSEPEPKATPRLRDWFSADHWDMILPYADLSAVWCPSDKKPMFSYESFMDAVDWMNKHPNEQFHGFGTSSPDPFVNKHEVAGFLASATQECGDSSLSAPYPWTSPRPVLKAEVWEGKAGGGLISILEGVYPRVINHPKGDPPKGLLVHTIDRLRPVPQKVLRIRDDESLSIVIDSLAGANQPGFGLPNSGAVVNQPGLCAVSQDGTLYGDQPASSKDVVVPTKELKYSLTDPRYSCSQTFCQYGGRNMKMLSYNYNLTWCSMDLFGDYRLVRYPNLLITLDRKTFNGHPKTFGFPGPKLDGANQLPNDIHETTPNVRVLGPVTSLWFWMKATSGRKLTCHECMMQPSKYGVSSAFRVINNQDGLTPGTWAADKMEYYKRICRILGIDCSKTIVNPPGQA